MWLVIEADGFPDNGSYVTGTIIGALEKVNAPTPFLRYRIDAVTREIEVKIHATS